MIAEYCLYPDDCNDTTTCEFCLIGQITTLTAKLEAATKALEGAKQAYQESAWDKLEKALFNE